MPKNERKSPSKRRFPKRVPFLVWYLVAMPLALGFMFIEFFLAVG
jgi:hypothetical protein